MSEELDLKRSREIVGPLYKVLLDANGNVIDGFHRREADPDWPTETLEWVKDEETRELVRAHANLQRRMASAEEHKQAFLKIAQKMKEKGVRRGKIVTEIAKVTGFTDRCVRELLPDEFKAIEHAAEPEHVPVPEHIFAEDYKCPLCGARYHVFHISGEEHKFDLKEGGKVASG